ncbi:MAG: hypothetical protein ACRC0X_06860 [Brevinema sp.]
MSGSVFDSEELPSNQEAYRQQLQPVIDNQFIIELIQSRFKSIDTRFTVFEERLTAIERRLDVLAGKHDQCHQNMTAVQQQGIDIKQVISALRQQGGVSGQTARDQGLTTELVKQFVHLFKKKHG